ncbi:hypothetical protein FAF44_28905 [Nonomuraea sp. MG754425]|uniref:hypothetical protein n=1 Tax=Nonomuraea sp. MG754425 TaxID=2570319 RepID=UPI001F35DA25|nr:hypothetical protein [Nonomuraea sp. MG754425]MCF6472384.1 hypothetical protein [Nonomuraea sp. MG754425]
MDFDLTRLDTGQFESLVQALAHEVLGADLEVYGPGPDGGRDATINGSSIYPGLDAPWTGYIVVQAKFLQRPRNVEHDTAWFLGQVRSEMERWADSNIQRVRRGRFPDHLIFATNVALSAVSGSGGIDRFNKQVAKIVREKALPLQNWRVWHYKKICSLLELSDVRFAYSAFITPSDVLAEVIGHRKIQALSPEELGDAQGPRSARLRSALPLDFVARLGRERVAYTGESFADARRAITSNPESPIPAAASGNQEILESQILLHLPGRHDYYTHPAGISQIQPSANRIIVNLDQLPLAERKLELAAYTLDCILPVDRGSCHEMAIPGLRVIDISEEGAHFTLAGTSAEVILAGPTPDEWRALLEAHKAACLDSGGRPLWNGSQVELAAIEADQLDHHAGRVTSSHDAAWIGSGLLRRVALFHTTASPYSIRYWDNSNEWAFELDHHLDSPMDHDSFIKKLTDSSFGIPLKIILIECSCRSCHCDDHYDRQCRLILEHQDKARPGTLQLRFRSIGNHSFKLLEGIRHDLLDMGADHTWVDRVLPGIVADPAKGRSQRRTAMKHSHHVS